MLPINGLVDSILLTRGVTSPAGLWGTGEDARPTPSESQAIKRAKPTAKVNIARRLRSEDVPTPLGFSLEYLSLAISFTSPFRMISGEPSL